MRIALVNALRHRDADQLQHFDGAFFRERGIRARRMQKDHFIQLIADGKDGV